MKLFDAFNERGYHTTIATTFAVDFTAYEQIALSRLREAGCMNNIVLADARMLTYALQDTHRPPKHAGRSYSLVGAETQKLFHPKLTLQLGPDSARLLVASANLTASGMVGNLEVVGQVRMGPDDEDHAGLMLDCLAYIEQFIPPSEHGARQQLEWARKRSPWLRHMYIQDRPDTASVLTSGAGTGIARRFADLVGAAPVKRLIVASPYWDENQAAVQYLQRALKPKTTALLIQPDKALFPKPKKLVADIYEVRALTRPKDRFAHAKVIIAQTAEADHVLFGSTNCTTAALGSASEPGSNAEASLYRRLGKGEAVDLLNLAKVLDDEPLPAERIKPFVREEGIPLQELQESHPGRFQLRGTHLTWTPSASFGGPQAVLELLDGKQQLVLVGPAPIGDPAVRVYHVAIEPPQFARVREDGRVSGLAVVHVEEMLMGQLRPAKTARIKAALDNLSGAELEGLFLYDALDLIDAEERRTTSAGARRSERGRGQAEPPAEKRPLTYEEFIRGRDREPAAASVTGNSLASSHTNDVRVLLNALVGIEAMHRAGEVDVEPSMPLGMGDETGGVDNAVEEGFDITEEMSPTDTGEGVADKPPPSHAQDTERAIDKTVIRFNKQIGDAAAQGTLTTRDLLRVRVLLSVILAAGSRRRTRRVEAGVSDKPPILLASGDSGWPRLAGQVLFQLFAPRNDEAPLMHKVNFDREEQGRDVPVDVLEFLATCFWVVAALMLAQDERGALTDVHGRAHERAAEMYGMSILEAQQLQSAEIRKVMQALSVRYGPRLGVDSAAVTALHDQLTAEADGFRERWLQRERDRAAELQDKSRMPESAG